MIVTRVHRVAPGAAPRLLCALLLILFCTTAYGNTAAAPDKPEAFLRFEEQGGTRRYYVEVYMKAARVGDLSLIRASLRDRTAGKQKLLSTVVAAASEGDKNFRIPFSDTEADILQRFPAYRVAVDTYPISGGSLEADLAVKMDVDISLDTNPRCSKLPLLSLFTQQQSNTAYAAARRGVIVDFLSRADIKQLITAALQTSPTRVEPRTLRSFAQPIARTPTLFYSCIEFAQPAGEYTLKLAFDASAPPELRPGGFTFALAGPDTADPTTEERAKDDFLDLGLTLTSSVADAEQPDKTTKRVRTTRGVTDLFFAPLLNYRTVDARGPSGGWVQVITPFFIDAKVSTGKITKDTLSLNRINLGANYEFRYYKTKAYSDLYRNTLGFKHTSDRDFKQDEVKFTYEFQPIFGVLNRPLGSAPDLLNEEVVPDDNDRFGLEIVPIVGIELGRTYRVRDPKEFEGVSRNVRRFYFGGDMLFDLTKYLRLSVGDRFYVRGEQPQDRTENYFIGSAEAPLGRIGKTRAAHALFFSFERGEQPPFDKPGVNVVKFGYRIRARGLLF